MTFRNVSWLQRLIRLLPCRDYGRGRERRSPMRRRRDARDFRRRTIRGTLLLSRAHARLNDIEEHSGPPGTIGTGGTMVPRDGGGRVRPGPRDHPEAIIYMSRATPKKTKGRLVGLARGRQGSHQATPSIVGTMVPTVPMVPRASKSFSGGVAPRLEFREAGLRTRQLRGSGPSGEMVSTHFGPTWRRRSRNANLNNAANTWCANQEGRRPSTSASRRSGFRLHACSEAAPAH